MDILLLAPPGMLHAHRSEITDLQKRAGHLGASTSTFLQKLPFLLICVLYLFTLYQAQIYFPSKFPRDAQVSN